MHTSLAEDMITSKLVEPKLTNFGAITMDIQLLVGVDFENLSSTHHGCLESFCDRGT